MRKYYLALLLLILSFIMVSCGNHGSRSKQQLLSSNADIPVSYPSLYWGYIDQTGKLIIPMKYQHATSFSQGLAAVSAEVGDKILYGYIDKSGKFVIKPKYFSAKPFSEGLAVVSSSHKVSNNIGDYGIDSGYINLKGEMVINQRFIFADKFSEGLAAVWTSHGSKRISAGYINKSGKLVIQVKSSKTEPFHEGIALTDTGFINRSGKLILLNKVIVDASTVVQSYEDPGSMTAVDDYINRRIISEGLIQVLDLKKHVCGYINVNGKIIIQPSFISTTLFSEGMGKVQTRIGQGYINHSGKMVIKPLFRAAQPFSEGFAGASPLSKYGDSSLFGYIDKSGKWVIKPKYDSTADFHEGLAAVRVGDKWGFIDKSGKMIVKPQYDSTASFSEGRAAVAVRF